MKWALYQAGQIGRRCDPQLASVYYREMVHHGKNHKQAMGAVMSHLGARVLAVLQENRPYVLRDTEGNPISREEARRLILLNYHVPEAIRQQRRRRNRTKVNDLKLRRKNRGMAAHRISEASSLLFLHEAIKPKFSGVASFSLEAIKSSAWSHEAS